MPEDAGEYFSWGNVDGHAAGSGYNFSQDVYSVSPGAAISEDIPLDHDAARVNLGGAWRMPTRAEFQELLDNCTSEWYTLNSVNGRLFTSNINGNTLFIPAAGHYTNTTLDGRGGHGYCWSSKYISDADAGDLYFSSGTIYPQGSSNRYLGFTVRAVMDPT